MTVADSIRHKLQTAFAPVHLTLEDESHGHPSRGGVETHFRLFMVTSVFEGLSRLDRQRRVQDLLADERDRGLHALTMRLMTPTEWEAEADRPFVSSPACLGHGPNDDDHPKKFKI